MCIASSPESEANNTQYFSFACLPLSLFGDDQIRCSAASHLRFLEIMKQQPFKHGGYWLVKLELCSSLWLKIARQRPASQLAACVVHGPIPFPFFSTNTLTEYPMRQVKRQTKRKRSG
jgi:hypothetical protein